MAPHFLFWRIGLDLWVVQSRNWGEMTRYVLIAVVVAPFLQTSTEAQDAEPEGAKALDHFVGSWSTEATEKLPELAPDGGEHTARESTSWILKNRFVIGREVRQPDNVGEETLAKWSKTDKAEGRAPELAVLESRGNG